MSIRTRVSLVSVAVSIGASASLVPVGTAVAPVEAAETAEARVERTIKGKAITESSGLARSTYSRPVLFTHNDSGDSARVFAVSKAGRTRAVLRLRGASAVDWEDISTGPEHSVWVGDIGDNGRSREKITVYRFTEPKRLPRRGRSVKVATKKYTFTYPDRPRDAEALLVHPRTGRLFIVTKSAEGDPGIYRAPKKLSRSSTNTLKRIADAPLKITAGTFSPDGKTRVLSSYTTAYTYRKFTGRPASVTLPTRRQGESLEVNRRGTEVLLGSEGEKSPVLAIAMTTPPS